MLNINSTFCLIYCIFPTLYIIVKFLYIKWEYVQKEILYAVLNNNCIYYTKLNKFIVLV
jgi:hypothetical protein